MGKDQSKSKKDPMDQLLDASFEMRQQSKMLEKESQRAQQKADAEKKRAMGFMNKGDMESAKIVAGEAIRYTKESVNLNRMGAKMGAVALKLDSAYRTQ